MNNAQPQTYYASFAIQLLNHGYEPIPVLPNSKKVTLMNWPSIAIDHAQVRSLAAQFPHYGIGIRTTHTPAIDIDITDEAASHAVKDMMLQELGLQTPQRVGRAPKTLLLCKTSNPFKKIKCVFLDTDGNEHAIEILGDGQQFVAFGIHEKTGTDYLWGTESPLNTPATMLPELSEARAMELLDKAANLLTTEFGWSLKPAAKPKVSTRRNNGGGESGFSGTSNKMPLNIRESAAKAALDKLPEEFVGDYDHWIDVGLACYHEWQGSIKGRDIWAYWSRNFIGYSDEELNAKWASFTGPHEGPQITFASVLMWAKTGMPQFEDAPDASENPHVYIEYLASMDSAEYEKHRKDAADALGMRVSFLDSSVEEVRKRLIPETPLLELSESSPLEEIEPWPEPVDGEQLLNSIYQLLKRYIIADDETLIAVTLWIAMSWFAPNATVLPIALITAPEKNCGKSALLVFISKLSCRALFASNISASAMFRALEYWKPSLIIDEADTFMKENPELIGIINAGHTRDTAYVIRNVGDNHQPTQFSTWGPKAIAGISAKKISSTLLSRSIMLVMRRKLPGEKTDNIRRCNSDEFQTLKRMLARWALDNGQRFACTAPEMEELFNRNADNWEPLLAIGEMASPAWAQKAEEAALKLTDNEEDDMSTNQQLLIDIREIYLHYKAERLHASDILRVLNGIDGSPWSGYNKGRPMSQFQLSKRLSDFEIHAKQIKINGQNRNGYELSQFDDAFMRYLEPPGENCSTDLPAGSLQGIGGFEWNTAPAANDAAGREVEQKSPRLDENGNYDFA